MTKLNKIILIASGSVVGATVIIVPTAIALSNKEVKVVKKVNLDIFEEDKIISDYIQISSSDNFIDFEIDLSLLQTHSVSFPRNFLIAENSQRKPLIVVDLKNVYLDDNQIDPTCYELNYNGIRFTRPIFNVTIDKKLTGRLTVANPELQVDEYRFTWMWK